MISFGIGYKTSVSIPYMLPLVKLGFPGTRFAATAPRLFNFSSVGKMAGRDIQSSSAGNSGNRTTDATENDQRQPLLWTTSQASYEEHFPSLSASVTSNKKGKRRAGTDLGNSSEQRQNKIENNVTLPHGGSTSIGKRRTRIDLFTVSEQEQKKIENNVTLQHETDGRSTSISPREHTNMHMKTNSPGWKKPGLNGNTRQSPKPSKDVIENEPFDICLPETGQPVSPGSSVMKGYGGDSAPKAKAEIQSAEENDKTKDNDAVEETGQVLRPGMVLFKHYVSPEEQVDIVNTCRELGCGPGGFYRPGYNDGAKLRLYMMCLGLDWDPQTRNYGQIRQHGNVAPPAIPRNFISLVSRVLDDSHTLIKRNFRTLNPEEVLPTISPDVCIVNFYTSFGRLGLHQDRDETVESLRKGLPVVSISIGDSAEFLYGDERHVNKAKSVELESGDVLIFGGESRHIFHGVNSIIPDTAPPNLREFTNLRPGRLNLTFRKY